MTVDQLVVVVERDRDGWHVARLQATGRELGRSRRRDVLLAWLRDTHATVVERT